MNWAEDVLDTSFPVWVALLAAVVLLGVRAAVLLRRHARATPVVVPAPESAYLGLVPMPDLPQHPWASHRRPSFGHVWPAFHVSGHLARIPANDGLVSDLVLSLWASPTDHETETT